MRGRNAAGKSEPDGQLMQAFAYLIAAVAFGFVVAIVAGWLP